MRDLLVFNISSPTGGEYFYIITESLELAKIKVTKFIINDQYFKNKYRFIKRVTWESLELDGWSIRLLPNIIYKSDHDLIKAELFINDEYLI